MNMFIKERDNLEGNLNIFPIKQKRREEMSMVLSFIGKSKPKMQFCGQEYSIP